MKTLTDRQRREVEYHRTFAAGNEHILSEPMEYEIIQGGRWWNQGWSMYGALKRLGVRDQRVLVVGCGFGSDVVRIARMGADVYGFDISPESLAIARKLAAREGAQVHLDEMPSERLSYPSGFFDVVVARDILHHVDIEQTMRELRRVAKPNARIVISEVYSHSWTEKVRRSYLVERVLHRKMIRFIYGKEVPYVTEDERKLTEMDIAHIKVAVRPERTRYFHLFVMRLIPDNYRRISQADQVLLNLLGRIGSLFAGRIEIEGAFR